MALSNLRYEQVPYEGYLSEGTPRTMPRATASMPPREMTLEEYLDLMNPQRRATLSEPQPQGLQAGSPPAAPSYEQYYRGRGSEGEMAYTNIPEVAEQRGLRKFDLAPPVAQVGGVEMYGAEAPTGSISPWKRKSPLEYAQMTGAFGPTSPQTNLMPRTTEEAQAEVQRMITVGRQKGYADNDILADIRERGLDKMLTIKPEYADLKEGEIRSVLNRATGKYEEVARGGVKPKEEKLPAKIEEFEMLYPEMKGQRGTPEYKKAYMDATARGQQGDFRNESSMRKEFLTLPEVKDYPIVQQQSQRALKALETPGSKLAVDQSIITTFNKMLDPTSVVRESEYARTPQDQALLGLIKGKWEKLSTGGAGLTDDERQSLYRMISNFSQIADDQYNQQVDYYSGLAERYGYQPENVVRLGGKKTTQPSAAATGGGVMADLPSPTEHTGRIVKDTDTGKRYKSNGTSWQEVQ